MLPSQTSFLALPVAYVCVYFILMWSEVIGFQDVGVDDLFSHEVFKQQASFDGEGYRPRRRNFLCMPAFSSYV